MIAAETGAAGLSSAEAAIRLRAYGPNALPSPDHRGPLRIIVEVMREPMFLLLIGGGFIYLLLGDLGEALILLLFASVSVVVTLVQELRSERVLDKLRDLTMPQALVIRDAEEKRVPAVEIVPGDLLIVSEGDRIAADGLLVSGTPLSIDESMLTGESVPVSKSAEAAAEADRRVYGGALAVGGQAVVEVSATGVHSELGRIGLSLAKLEREPPRLAVEIRRLVRAVALIAAAVCLTVVVTTGLFRGGWLQGVLNGIALGMALLPEEFPLVLTVFTVMGAWRISQASVLTRRSDAIEALGSATVLCSDKTGTLTQNRMTIVRAWANGETYLMEEDAGSPVVVELIQTGTLASSEHPVDPMEKAFHAAAAPWTTGAAGMAVNRVWGVQPGRPAVAQAWLAEEGPGVVALKGAPETVAALCGLSEQEAGTVLAAVGDFAASGLRVLGIARLDVSGAHKGDLEDLTFEFLGLVGLADPVRPGVPAAVSECRSAGVRVVMITGDHPETARAIAREAGIDAARVMTGVELAALDDTRLAAQIETISVFARVRPDDKLRIVRALQANGEVVAMTGDGVNDAPALKAADIGVAMGGRGTDVAREAASLVLLNDDFGSIVQAMRLGRRIYDNLQKAIGFVIAVHVPLAAMALLPLLFGLPAFLAPVHIAFMELIIDPVCSLVFEAEREEDDLMRRPPRPAKAALLSRASLLWPVVQGSAAALVVGAVYLLALGRGLPAKEARTIGFLTLVAMNFSLVLMNRTRTASALDALMRPNPWLWPVAGAATLILGLAVTTPLLGRIFGFESVAPSDVLIALLAAVVGFAMLEASQHLRFGRLRPARPT